MRTICLAGAVVLALILQSPALAHDLGVRGIITASDGEPANDIPGFGVFGHWRLGDRWSAGVAVDQTEYDLIPRSSFLFSPASTVDSASDGSSNSRCGPISTSPTGR